jgi:hypothetical protein
MWNGRGRAGVAVLVGALAGACGGKGERPATRPEALAACIKGCVGKVEAVAGAAPTPEQRRTCDQTCGCIVDEMFLPSGEQRADGKPMSEIAVACARRFAGAATPAAPASPLPFPGLMPLPAVRGEKDLPPRSKVVLGRTLIAGTRCGKARLPKLAYDETNDRVALVGEPFSWELPASWKVRLERRDLLRTWGPPSGDGVYRVIELFVTPHCDGGYDTRPVYERIAARGLIGLNKQADTARQVRQHDWVTRLGGRGKTEVASPVAIETPEGTKTVSLYVTSVAETETYSVYAAAVCPVEEAACKDAYRGIAISPSW